MEYKVVRPDDELYHYGVLGMRWGVRRDRSGTINKAYNKLEKLDRNIASASSKATKAAKKASTGVSAKYNKLDVKATKLQSKADKKKYGFFPNAEKAANLQVKADRARYKANKYKHKADKRANIAAKTVAAETQAIARAQKWSRQMNNTIGSMKPSELTDSQIRLGRKYLGM